jgi:hypothetical protein
MPYKCRDYPRDFTPLEQEDIEAIIRWVFAKSAATSSESTKETE